jgi:hypothetical protein
VRGEEQVARKGGYRGDDRIPDDQAALLGDLDPLVHVGAGIFAADDVFGGREEPPQPEQHERHRDERRHAGSRRRRAVTQAPPAERRGDRRDDQITYEQAVKVVAANRREGDHQRQRHHQAEHDRPEQPLFRVEPRAPIAIEPGHPENQGAREKADYGEVEKDNEEVEHVLGF